jgi:hypothetical protein
MSYTRFSRNKIQTEIELGVLTKSKIRTPIKRTVVRNLDQNINLLKPDDSIYITEEPLDIALAEPVELCESKDDELNEIAVIDDTKNSDINESPKKPKKKKKQSDEEKEDDINMDEFIKDE